MRCICYRALHFIAAYPAAAAQGWGRELLRSVDIALDGAFGEINQIIRCYVMKKFHPTGFAICAPQAGWSVVLFVLPLAEEAA